MDRHGETHDDRQYQHVHHHDSQGAAGTPGDPGLKGDKGDTGERGAAGVWHGRRWIVIGYAFLALGTGAGFFVSYDNQGDIEDARAERVRQINGVNAAQCASLRNLYAVIRQTIEASDRNVDTLQYYKEHPDEAELVHEQNARTLAKFREPPCPQQIELTE